jgi:hypothetical protein
MTVKIAALSLIASGAFMLLVGVLGFGAPHFLAALRWAPLIMGPILAAEGAFLWRKLNA